MQVPEFIKGLIRDVANDADTPLELALQSSGAAIDYLLFKSGTLRELLRICLLYTSPSPRDS